VQKLVLLIFVYNINNSLLSQNIHVCIANNYKTGEFKFVYKQDTTWLYEYDSLKKIILKKEPIFITPSDQIPQVYKLKKKRNVFLINIFNYKTKISFTDTLAIIGSPEHRLMPQLNTVIDKIENISYDSRIEYDSTLSVGLHYVFNAYSSGNNYGDSFCYRYFFSKEGLHLDRIEYFNRKGFNGKWTRGWPTTLSKSQK
jgi:hypothetical protein